MKLQPWVLGSVIENMQFYIFTEMTRLDIVSSPPKIISTDADCWRVRGPKAWVCKDAFCDLGILIFQIMKQ